MRSPSSTVVVLAGAVTDAVVGELGRLPNVQALRLTGEGAPPVREVLGAASRPFLVHDLDPLAAVARAWSGYFDDPSTAGVLRVEVASALSAFAAGESVLPDYYLVLGAETLEPRAAAWWLGVLAATAPARVVPVAATTAAVRQALATLPAGRGWPDPAGWLPELHLRVPDHAGLVGPGGVTSLAR
ncbi:hypothetical protein N1031_11270 [Herbiconiux moechotypicola]|uniref:Uncharacterized protein n=1 Tax=Herbiconiux moechotypicola TaxID=637393 RepID=A0ABP5QIR2_9MICO|nr:hypothetical protein [Herbiconiux moechotypicola]MCS5730341.1 hypothetical protein [Herbiconiux moechotypicola]